MFSDDGKPVSAALFVPMIEQLGLAFELDKLVLNLAIQDMQTNPWLHVAINISGLTASQSDWPRYLKQTLEGYPDIAKRLVYEITETAVIVDIEETKRFVQTARDLGGRISLDDFGAGSTSIRYLRELDLAIMKIDKDLLGEIKSNKEQQHMVSILIELARGLGIETVAEGVEDEETAQWLRQARVNYLQGYHFGKPSLELPQEDHGALSFTPPIALLKPETTLTTL